MPTQVASDNTSGSKRELKGTKIGLVTRAKGQKTRTVTVAYQVQHSKYGKYLKRQTNYRVHDHEEASEVGDRVEIVSCRPISKTKSWRLVRIIERGAQLEGHRNTDAVPSDDAG